MNIRGNQLSYRSPEAGSNPILDGVNITLEAGRITLLIGRTGSGKSTLLNLISGLKAPSEGQVYIGEVRLWNNGKVNGELLPKLGFVYQYPEHQFFLPSVRRELQYSLKPLRLNAAEEVQRIGDAARQTGLREDMLERSPFHLSGGERRKAALSSVLAVQPDWLLLDEPSSGLDSTFSTWLAAYLEQFVKEKPNQRGIVIATHDLDLFLPIADSVVMVKDGRVMGQWSAEETFRHPEWFEAAGVGVPDCVRLARWAGGRNEGVTPEEMAQRIAARLRQGQEMGEETVTVSNTNNPLAQETMMNNQRGDGVQLHPDASPNRNPFTSLDPRAKWAWYLLFTVGIFLNSDWFVSIAGLAIVIVLASVAHMPMSKWRRALLPMASFMCVAFLISGIQPSVQFEPFSLAGTRFDWGIAFGSLERLVPLLPVMAGGTLFAYSTSPLSLKKGLEAPLKAIPGFSKGAEVISMSTSLLFRFLQLIPSEMERFALLASHRGRRGGKPGKLRIRQLPAFFTPLLLSVMQHAEDLSVAMESRGYNQAGVKRTNAAPLRWTRKDGAACMAGLVMAVLLAGLGYLL